MVAATVISAVAGVSGVAYFCWKRVKSARMPIVESSLNKPTNNDDILYYPVVNSPVREVTFGSGSTSIASIRSSRKLDSQKTYSSISHSQSRSKSSSR